MPCSNTFKINRLYEQDEYGKQGKSECAMPENNINGPEDVIIKEMAGYRFGGNRM